MTGIIETAKAANPNSEGSNVCAGACQNGAGVKIHGNPYTVAMVDSTIVIAEYKPEPKVESPEQTEESEWLE